MKQIAFALFLLASFHSVTSAQTGINPAYTALKVGDQVPDLPLDNMINYHSPVARISDFRGKLLILDFWSSGCGSCIKSFPRIDSLQQLYRDRVQFILVNCKITRDTRKVVEQFANGTRNKNFPIPKGPMLTEDENLYALFPFESIPHYAWIDRDGKVAAITSGLEVTVKNIDNMLSGNAGPLKVKADRSRDTPLYLDMGADLSGMMKYSILVKGSVPGMGSGNLPRKSDKGLYGNALTNLTALEIYGVIAAGISENFDVKRIKLNVKDESLLRDPGGNEEQANPWRSENFYTYDFVVPDTGNTKIYPLMLADLNNSWAYTAGFVEEIAPCYELVLTDDGRRIKTKGGEPEIIYGQPSWAMRNQPWEYFVVQLKGSDALPYPVVDMTGLKGNADISFNLSLSSLFAINAAIAKYGLKLVETRREMQLFEIRDR